MPFVIQAPLASLLHSLPRQKKTGSVSEIYEMGLGHLNSPNRTSLYACSLVGGRSLLACYHTSSSCSAGSLGEVVCVDIAGFADGGGLPLVASAAEEGRVRKQQTARIAAVAHIANCR